MFLSKVRFAVIIPLTLGLIGSGAGFVAHRTKAEQPASKPTPAPAAPATVADKAKEKEPGAKPKPKADKLFVDPQMDMASRLKAWRDKLNQRVDFPGYDNPKIILSEVLDDLSDRYGLVFRLNEKAFKFDNIAEPGKAEVASPEEIPAMKTSLANILRTILARVPAPSGAAYLFRKDHVEITTNEFIRLELGRPDKPVDPDFPEASQFIVRPERSLMWDAFEDTPVAQIMQRIADDNGLNVVMDPRVAKNLQLKTTVQFNNVAVGTAVRLLANMADVSMVQVDNVFYVTTEEKAKRLRKEQARIHGEMGMGGWRPLPTKPAPEKPTR